MLKTRPNAKPQTVIRNRWGLDMFNRLLVAIVFILYSGAMAAIPPERLDVKNYPDIKSADLREFSRGELTVLRSSIYARHGYVFKQSWLQNHFESLPWYTKNPDFKFSDLSFAEFSTANYLQERIDEKKPVRPVGLQYRMFSRISFSTELPREWTIKWAEIRKARPDVVTRSPLFLKVEVAEPLSIDCGNEEIERDSCSAMMQAAYDPTGRRKTSEIAIAGYSGDQLILVRKPSLGPSIYPGDTYILNENGMIVAIFQDSLGTTCSTSVILDYFQRKLVTIEYTTYCTGKLIGSEKIFL